VTQQILSKTLIGFAAVDGCEINLTNVIHKFTPLSSIYMVT
jgi:hypothetical protein